MDKPIKIYINARFLTQSITGVQRFALEIVKSIDQLYENNEISKQDIVFELIAPHNIQQEINLKHLTITKKGSFKGHIWEQLELPLFVKDGFLLNLCNTAPLFKRYQTIAIHDAAVFAKPMGYTFLFRTWYKILYTTFGKTLKNVFTVSTFSKKELIKYCGINESKLTVIQEGKEHIFSNPSDTIILDKHNITNKPYVLAVSSLNPNKNFQSIVTAINELKETSIDIVIAGGTDPKVFQGSSDLPKNVKHVGYVTDSELRALYENASCFIFPSYYEGFGLPPLEAMACGCPLIVSNTASMPEVCGDAALYCDPYNPSTITAALEKILSDDSLRKSLKENGLSRADNFKWKQSAQDVIKQLKTII